MVSKVDPFAEREAKKYIKPIPSREYILELIQQVNQPLRMEDIFAALNLEPEDGEPLRRRVKAMLRDAQLERLRGGYFWPSSATVQVIGVVQIDRKNKYPSVIPDDGSEPVLITAYCENPLYAGNQVEVKIATVQTQGMREGRVVKIIKQQTLTVTGRFIVDYENSFVVPYSKEILQDIIVEAKNINSAEHGDIVLVKIIQHASRNTSPQGTITKVLGNENTKGIEVTSALHSFDLPYKWPKEVIQEIKAIPKTLEEKSLRGRLDLRDLPLVTIDGEDAKDFDDAVFCEPRSRGGWKLYVAIADVSYYVKPDSALDAEAQNRGNSVYFPGMVIPMLPEVLSNNLCSLRPNEDRLCMVCEMSISSEGKLTRYDFHEGVIRSHARFTYTEVAAILQGSRQLNRKYNDLVPHLQELNNLYKILVKSRKVRGALDFDTVETKIIFNHNKKINSIQPVFRNDAHKIIEECMLCANVATAKFLRKNKLAGLYRNHDTPPAEKVADVKQFLAGIGLKLNQPTSSDYSELLGKIKDRDDAHVIQTILLRSLAQAVYSAENNGHFGLAFKEYSHFTSPIRRYPDLWVHRQIGKFLRSKTDKKPKINQDKLQAMADRCSMTEKRADGATRDVERWLKCQYMAKRVGDIFSGTISGVTNFGFFVELKDIYIDGLVHVTSLNSDYYTFDKVQHKLIGRRSGKSYGLGDRVDVRLGKVDIDTRRIDLDLLMPKKLVRTKKNKSKNKTQKKK